MRQSVLTMTGSLFLKLFSRLRPLSLLRAPCVCAGGERERKSNNNNSKVHWPYTLRACCLCVCVLLSVVDGKRSEGPTRVYVSRPLDALFEGPPNVDFGCPVICTALLL